MKVTVKKILKKVNYKNNKPKSKEYTETINPSKRLLVGLIGPSGVGKSTHYKKFKKITSIAHLHDSKVSKMVDKKNIKYEHIKDYHKVILHRSFESLENYIVELGLSEYDYIWLINYLSKEILTDIKCLHMNECIIQDGGIFHEFTEEIIELANNNLSSFEEALTDRIFIFLNGEPDQIYQQRLKRNKRFDQIDEETILNEIDRTNYSYKALIDILRSFSMPILFLQLENGIDENVKLMDEFIKTILKQLPDKELRCDVKR